jgi:CDP-diacylglycerol--glycerol-3-phosphate 3-phosphatidyltransferase
VTTLSGATPHSASPNRFLTISNLLSISRAVLVIPFAYAMLGDSVPARFWGAIIMCLAALTDKFDGVLARKLNQITDWGKILDPLADKIAVTAVAVVLVLLGNIPIWFLAAIVLRDLLIFTGGMYVKSKKGVLLQSNEVGKWTVGIVSLALFLMVLNAQTIIVDIAIAASTILLLVSFWMYLKRFLEVMKD